jgi:hypothetical protein
MLLKRQDDFSISFLIMTVLTTKQLTFSGLERFQEWAIQSCCSAGEVPPGRGQAAQAKQRLNSCAAGMSQSKVVCRLLYRPMGSIYGPHEAVRKFYR